MHDHLCMSKARGIPLGVVRYRCVFTYATPFLMHEAPSVQAYGSWKFGKGTTKNWCYGCDMWLQNSRRQEGIMSITYV